MICANYCFVFSWNQIWYKYLNFHYANHSPFSLRFSYTSSWIQRWSYWFSSQKSKCYIGSNMPITGLFFSGTCDAQLDAQSYPDCWWSRCLQETIGDIFTTVSTSDYDNITETNYYTRDDICMSREDRSSEILSMRSYYEFRRFNGRYRSRGSSDFQGFWSDDRVWDDTLSPSWNDNTVWFVWSYYQVIRSSIGKRIFSSCRADSTEISFTSDCYRAYLHSWDGWTRWFWSLSESLWFCNSATSPPHRSWQRMKSCIWSASSLQADTQRSWRSHGYPETCFFWKSESILWFWFCSASTECQGMCSLCEWSIFFSYRNPDCYRMVDFRYDRCLVAISDQWNTLFRSKSRPSPKILCRKWWSTLSEKMRKENNSRRHIIHYPIILSNSDSRTHYCSDVGRKEYMMEYCRNLVHWSL